MNLVIEVMLRVQPFYYDRKGGPISHDEWNALFCQPYVHVGLTRVRRWDVSTMWLGTNFLQLTPPMLFESIIFQLDRKGRRVRPVWEERYSTEREALRGHSELCRMIHSGWRGRVGYPA